MITSMIILNYKSFTSVRFGARGQIARLSTSDASSVPVALLKIGRRSFSPPPPFFYPIGIQHCGPHFWHFNFGNVSVGFFLSAIERISDNGSRTNKGSTPMTWRTYTCEISSKPAIVLIDQQFENRFPVPELPLLSWFGVYCNLPPDGSCWAEAEADSLDSVENQLIEVAGQFGSGWAVYVLRIATVGIREYYIYHSGEAEMSKAFDALKLRVPNYRIEFETTTDSLWDQYRRYSAFNDNFEM